MFRAVDVRTEMSTFFGKFTVFGKRENLKAATVGQYRLIPAVEFMETSSFSENAQTWSKIQVVCVSKNDLCFYFVFQFSNVNAFNRSCRTDGHENRRKDFSVVGRNASCTGVTMTACMLNFELHRLIFDKDRIYSDW